MGRDVIWWGRNGGKGGKGGREERHTGTYPVVGVCFLRRGGRSEVGFSFVDLYSCISHCAGKDVRKLFGGKGVGLL